MNVDVKRKWIEALRSGEYRQGRECLRVTSGNKKAYCCLGVLCDLYAKETGHVWEENKFFGNRLYLPPNVSDWAELPLMSYSDNNPQTVLSKLNDSGCGFLLIAKHIEENM